MMWIPIIRPALFTYLHIFTNVHFHLYYLGCIFCPFFTPWMMVVCLTSSVFFCAVFRRNTIGLWSIVRFECWGAVLWDLEPVEFTGRIIIITFYFFLFSFNKIRWGFFSIFLLKFLTYIFLLPTFISITVFVII